MMHHKSSAFRGAFFMGQAMLKRLSLSLALILFAASAWAAGTVPGFNLIPVFDLTGKLAPNCALYVIQAGTTSTPQNSYQDSSLTILNPNPLRCDASGRLGQWFVADGNIKLRLTTSVGTAIFTQDNLLVIGASSGGGGGGSVDPTTILATGDFKSVYGTGSLTGFVRCNGRTIGNASSGASERANADTSALFSFLYTNDTNLAVSGGRGASASADYAANKTIALPDCRGRALAGLDDMGNSAAGRLTSTYFGVAATTLGNAGGSESTTLTLSQIPTGITSANTGSIALSVASGNIRLPNTSTNSTSFGPSGSPIFYNDGGSNAPLSSTGTVAIGSAAVTSNNTGGGAHRTASPAILVTTYIKL